MPPYLIEIYVSIFGLFIGSFLNVCIHRLPVSASIVHPRSMCPSCGSMIRFYDNIPVISYLFLKGRCRHCSAAISLRYPLVEIISALFAFCVYLKYGPTWEGFIYYTFIASLIVVIFIDLDHQIIPDVITLPGIPLFFFATFFISRMTFMDSLLGILAGGGSLFLISWIYELVRKKTGMGGGDIKLLAMIGALTGWKGVVFTIYVASAVGTLVGISAMLYRHKDMQLKIPFGPFLSLGVITYIFFGSEIINWYFKIPG